MIGTTAFIGIRYSRARSDNRFLSFMTWISLLGLTLGVIALIVVISVMNGFGAELERRILGAIPHIIVTDADVSPDELRDITGVTGVSRFSRHSALLINGSSSNSELVGLYGIEPSLEKTISIIRNKWYPVILICCPQSGSELYLDSHWPFDWGNDK